MQVEPTVGPPAGHPEKIRVEEHRSVAVLADLDADPLIRRGTFAFERVFAFGVVERGGQEAAIVHGLPFLRFLILGVSRVSDEDREYTGGYLMQ